MRALLLALLIAISGAKAAPSKPYPVPGLNDKVAVAFDAVDAKGRHWTLADTQSKPVLIDFWATWCRPCLDAMPDLNNFHKKHQDRLTLLGLNIDIQGRSVADPMAARYGLVYPIAVVEPKLSKAFGAKGYPYMVLIYQGRIVKTLSGGHRVKDLEKELAPWL